MKYFIILSGFFIQWLDTEEELNEMLHNKDFVCTSSMEILVCGHMNEDTIYFYNGNREVNCNVIEVANKWHNTIGSDKVLNYGVTDTKKAV